MKYESDILKRLIDTYGVVGNPQYISEIIKEFIVQGKECFPNLFTYQSDWLAHIDEFGLKPSYTVSYTGQSIYAPNTLEKPVKSAILKGSTKYRDIDTGEFLETFEEGRNLELVSVKMPVLHTRNNLFNGKMEMGGYDTTTGNKASYTTRMRCVDFIVINNPSNTIMEIINSRRSDDLWVLQYDNNKNYLGKDLSFNIPKGVCKQKLNLTSDCAFIKFYEIGVTSSDLGEIKYIVSDKTNILTVNEDVELRGIGDVRDTLDCLSGEVVKNTEKFMLDGTQSNVVKSSQYSNESYSTFAFNDFIPIIGDVRNIDILCGKLPNIKEIGSQVPNQEGISYISSGYGIRISILNSRLETADISGLNKYLSKNPISFVCPITEKSIKTVDLSILDQNGQNVKQLMSFNGGTHFNTGSSVGSPLPTVSVSVETDLEETIKVCSLEGNTL